MNDWKRDAKGSETRDTFKHVHKSMSRSFYSCDIDFVWVEKNPPGIVAFLDYKQPKDHVTFAEVLAYNRLLSVAPIYVVESPDPANGPFKVMRYLGGDSRPEPPEVTLAFVANCPTLAALGVLEAKLRQQFRKANRG